MKVKTVGNYNSQILVNGERYRVTNISKLVGIRYDTIEVEAQPIPYGLNIEQKLPDGHYAVVLTVKYDLEEKEPYIVSIDDRDIQTLKDLVEEVKEPSDVVCYLEEYLNCIDFAKQALTDIYEVEDDEVDPKCVC